MELPPGPRQPPLVQTFNWVFRPTAFMTSAGRRFGSIFTARLGGFDKPTPSPVVFVADPAVIKKLFTGGPELSWVGESRLSLVPIVGEGSVLILDGDEHLRHRRRVLPPLHGDRMKGFRDAIRDITLAEMERWPLDRPFELRPHMQTITFEVILRVVFGLESEAERAAIRPRVMRLLDVFATVRSELLLALPPRVGPFDFRKRFDTRKRDVDEALFAIMARRRAEGLDERADALSLLLGGGDDEPMSDQQIADELVTLLIAGHESTAVALAWAFELLFRRPDAMGRLTEECRNGGGGEYLSAVVDETLRLWAPFPICTRALKGPVELGGYQVPGGTSVVPCLYLLHRRPDLYEDPETFRPERFLEGEPPPYGFVPFGGGTRRCVGAALAPFEMRVVLETVLSRCRLEPASPRPEKPRRRAIVLAPGGGAKARLTERATLQREDA